MDDEVAALWDFVLADVVENPCDHVLSIKTAPDYKFTVLLIRISVFSWFPFINMSPAQVHEVDREASVNDSVHYKRRYKQIVLLLSKSFLPVCIMPEERYGVVELVLNPVSVLVHK
jgi:hypothetical protein